VIGHVVRPRLSWKGSSARGAKHVLRGNEKRFLGRNVAEIGH
jgi:hypothetical protein